MVRRMRRRVVGIDVARGVASLVMIQGHAYHGWVAPAVQDGFAYRFTRLLGTIPLPAFLVLAGAAVNLRVRAGAATAAPRSALRKGLIRRGLQVVGWGYATSALYAAMDGAEGWDTLLRTDVLHVIGASIALVGAVGLGGGQKGTGVCSLGFARRVAVLSLACALVSPGLNAFGPHVDGPARYLLAPFIDVPGVTRMPLFPLVAWLGVGVLACHLLSEAHARFPADPRAAIAGAPDRHALGLAAAGLLLAMVASWATPRAVALLGGELSRTHPAVLLNLVDLAGRGLLLLGLSVWASSRLPASLLTPLLRLGRGSLVAYVFHIPFCYGIVGRPLQGRLQMPLATLCVLLLMLASYAAVWLRDRLLATGAPLQPSLPSGTPACPLPPSS